MTPEPHILVVDDDGPRIAPERIETVFEPFVRGEGSRSLATGGAGLGLSIARSMVRAHGGEVALKNREGGGLTAQVVLPRRARVTRSSFLHRDGIAGSCRPHRRKCR